jgi:hypothetical protein
MRPSLILIATAIVAYGAVGAPAGVASAAQSAVETIGLLEAEGYHVYIDRIGDAPLEDCTVTSIRNPQTVIKLIRVDRRDGAGKDVVILIPVVVSKSIMVSLDCVH